LPILRERLGSKTVKLFLTCELSPGATLGAYRADEVSNLVRQLNIAQNVVQLGTVPYDQLHHLYKACDVYVSPAYAESFAHPLVEAMASGLPIVISDLPVHREICGDAALYFSRFSPDELAEKIWFLADSQHLAEQSSQRGQLRANDFSWKKHVEALIKLAQELRLSAAASERRGIHNDDESIAAVAGTQAGT
jgi:glycosyltransferase involved in cell wall biosynthesis